MTAGWDRELFARALSHTMLAHEGVALEKGGLAGSSWCLLVSLLGLPLTPGVGETGRLPGGDSAVFQQAWHFQPCPQDRGKGSGGKVLLTVQLQRPPCQGRSDAAGQPCCRLPHR